MVVCRWFSDGKVLMTLTKEDGQYFIDGRLLDEKTGSKLSSLDYENALKELKMNN